MSHSLNCFQLVNKDTQIQAACYALETLGEQDTTPALRRIRSNWGREGVHTIKQEIMSQI